MEDIWTIIISAIILIGSSAVGLFRKKTPDNSRKVVRDNNQESFFPFLEEDENSLENYPQEDMPAKKQHFTYDNPAHLEDVNEISLKEDINMVENEDFTIEKDFDLKKAIIYSEILNRKYN